MTQQTPYSSRLLTAGQAMAEKREDYKTLLRALSEYKEPVVKQALALLKSDSLYRSEKVLGPCQFLAEIHASMSFNARHDCNKIWRAVATAPSGFCHPRSSMVGTLLDDIVAGLSFEDAAAKFKAKMHPLQYQRPQAAPSVGNVVAAEKLVEKLGIAPALERRFARVEEIHAIWRPYVAPSKSGGVFAHLKTKGEVGSTMHIPSRIMSWVKFEKDVLPGAKEIKLLAPSHGPYTAILTAQNEDAPPILQWDSESTRNPFSAYVYASGSYASGWSLHGERWTKVTAVTRQPNQWFGGNFDNHANGIILVLEGAKDNRSNQGNALFPEILKSDLRSVRSTIEAYSKSAKIHGFESASACGLSIGPSRGNATVNLRVVNDAGVSDFAIDRFE